MNAVSNFVCPSIVLQPPRRNRSTAQSGTGLDGPQSSESDKLSKMLRDGLGDLKGSSRSADISTDSQKTKSNTYRSIDWGKNWEKRKPRRKHDVSEISNSDFAYRAHDNDPAATAHADGDSNTGSDSEDISDNKSCSRLSQHDAQFHAIRRYALNSCPELHRQLDDYDKSLSRLKTTGNQDQITQLRTKLEKNPHRYHFHIRNIVRRQFRYLSRRLRRSDSSNFSVRSEFPARLDSKERRLLARESVDVWPSSVEETPIFNTPESNITGPLYSVGHHFDPLAIASMMIATGELDRLSSGTNFGQVSGTSGSSTGFTGSSPTSHTPYYSGAVSPNNETSISDSTLLGMPPTIPFNTPASSGPQSGVVSPVSRPSQRRGRRRRAQRSRLSEVTTPDKIASPAELAEEFAEGTTSLSAPQIETLPECSRTPVDGTEINLYPKPLAINRNCLEEAAPGKRGPSKDTQGQPPESSTSSPFRIVAPEKARRSQFAGSLSSEDSISAPTRISSIGKTPESMYGRKEPSSKSPAKSPSAGLSNLQESGSTANAINELLTTELEVVWTKSRGKSNEVASSDSCHPDTWTESQGEPGNSDPFCPPDCLESRHSSQDNSPLPSQPIRQGSGEIACVPGTSEKAESNGCTGSRARG